ncbi:hypothetical protein [Streptomyces flavidovirens]|uniref:hypothetical protein n=1 Tax=Streptomyces flavidovirens TaxID=67298 RepID=UPI0003FD7FCD|nr:hypothetical protein [Streptomyces flavidovirens]
MIPKLAKVRLNASGHGTVELDGQPIPGVRAVTVRTEANCRPLIIIELLAHEVDVRQGAQEVESEEAA